MSLFYLRCVYASNNFSDFKHVTEASFFKALLEGKVYKDKKCFKLFNIESAFGDIVHIV